MRTVVLYELMSLDGVGEEPSDWLHELDQAYVDHLARVIARQDTVLLGRRTHEYWAGYWPTAPHEPFASFINGTPKHVVGSRRPAVDWAGTTFVDRPLTDHVRELKAGEGGDIGVHGSLTLANALLAAGLVDELQLVVAPVVAGHGRRLFDDTDQLRALELVDCASTPAGLLLLGYRVPASG